jgi:amino acid permease
MVNFFIIAIFVVLVIFIAFKWNNLRTKTAFIFIFLGISFLLLTGYLILSGKGVNFSTVEGISSAAKTYVSWIGIAGSNIIKVSSYALNQEWKSDSITNSTG